MARTATDFVFWQMQVVGLVSGGKDSIWNLHYCTEFGHTISCLANLSPPAGVTELDSYMYQTVGHDLIDGVAEAMGLPLVRRVIAGKPTATSSNAYSPSDGDEVEDLTLLLEDVLRSYPEVKAVSCGAILSNYQRMRVENVCSRLGLKVLAFMWMQEQPILLRQMIAGSLDARIVKVASMGLDARHVGKSILDEAFTNHLFKLGAQWGVHVCGEGGEYETIVVDAPLFGSSISICESEHIEHEDGPEVVFLRAPRIEVNKKDCVGKAPFEPLQVYNTLAYYQDDFSIMLPRKSSTSDRYAIESKDIELSVDKLSVNATSQEPVLRRLGQVLVSSSIDVNSFDITVEGSPADQCKVVLEAIAAWLSTLDQSLSNVVFAEVQVQDLSCFESMNAVYASFFVESPPARVCVQTPLPSGIHVRLRLILRQSCAESAPPFESLRVQSISTWAMACIGPYSQAWRVGSLLFSAGVIGLIPHTMTLPSISQADSAAQMGDIADSPSTSITEAWQAELWMLMRSLQNVLKEMKSNFSEVVLAHIYTSRRFDFAAVEGLVLAYMSREMGAPVNPLVTCAVVPRLPKDGHIEINLVCATEGAVAIPQVASFNADPSSGVSGRCVLSTKVVRDSCLAITADFRTECEAMESSSREGATMSEEVAGYISALCLTSIRTLIHSQLRTNPAGLSIQVQYAESVVPHEILTRAIDNAIVGLKLSDSCATGFMPVQLLGESVPLRFIVLTAE